MSLPPFLSGRDEPPHRQSDSSLPPATATPSLLQATATPSFCATVLPSSPLSWISHPDATRSRNVLPRMPRLLNLDRPQPSLNEPAHSRSSSQCRLPTLRALPHTAYSSVEPP